MKVATVSTMAFLKSDESCDCIDNGILFSVLPFQHYNTCTRPLLSHTSRTVRSQAHISVMKTRTSSRPITAAYALDLPLDEYLRGWKRNVLGKPNPMGSVWITHYMELTELHPRTVAPILHISAYSFVRWHQGIDEMMKEKKGNFLVTKLTTRQEVTKSQPHNVHS
jgi:hypothetical protein